jgi:sulfur carrier protein
MKGYILIEVSINGKITKLENDTNIKQMINILNYKSKLYAVAINTTFISINKYEITIIKQGDTIDILAPIQGG